MARLHTVDAGVDLSQALAEISSSQTGFVLASGILASAVIHVDDAPRRLDGPSVIVNLSGPTNGPYTVAVARSGELVAGSLVSAHSAGVSVVVLPAEPAERLTVAKPREEARGFAARALATAEVVAKSEPEDEEPAMPESGDLIQHFAFGLCEVLMSDDESLKIRDLSGPGRIRDIRLNVLVVSTPTAHEGKRLFRLDRRR